MFFSCAFMFVLLLCVRRYVFFCTQNSKENPSSFYPSQKFSQYLFFPQFCSLKMLANIQENCKNTVHEKNIKFNLIKAWSAAMKPWRWEYRKFRKKWKLPELFRRSSEERAKLLGVCDEMKNHPPLNQIGKSCLPSSCKLLHPYLCRGKRYI